MTRSSQAQQIWERAISGKPSHDGNVEVLQLEESVTYAPYLLPGTMTVIVAADSEELSAAAALLRESRWDEVTLKLFEAEDALVQASSGIDAAAVLGELSYSESALLKGLGSPGDGLHTTLLMYGGGEVNPSQLRLTYFGDTEQLSLGAIVVVNPPVLSEIEIRLVAQAPNHPQALVPTEAQFWPVVAKEGAKFIATYLTGKAVDKIIQQEQQAAGRREQLRKVADRVGQENARNRYRNSSFVPDGPTLDLLKSAGDVQADQASQKLLEVRREILKRALTDSEDV